MANRQDWLRHDIIAQHASVQREKSQPSQALVTSSLVNAYASASRAHVSPPYFFHRRRMSLTHASLPPSSHRRQVSTIQASEAVEVPESPEVPQTLKLHEAPQEHEITKVPETPQVKRYKYLY